MWIGSPLEDIYYPVPGGYMEPAGEFLTIIFFLLLPVDSDILYLIV